MEKIMDDLKASELQQETLHKLFDEVHATASSILLFTFNWKELEGYFDSTRNLLRDQAQELALQDKKIREAMEVLEGREKEVESKFKEFKKCMDKHELREKELGLLKESIRECDLEIKLKEEKLNLLREQIVGCHTEVYMEKKELVGIQKSIDLKNKELGGIQNLMEERGKELDFKEKTLSGMQKLIEECSKDFASEEKHLESIKVLIDEYKEELEAREKEYDAMKKSITECSAELEWKEKHLDSIRVLIKESNKQLEAKDKAYDAMKKSIAECSVDLKLKQENVRKCDEEFQSKEKVLNTLKKTVKSCHKDMELKEREFNAIRMSIEERNEELQGKEKELKSVHSSIEECKVELQAMQEQKHLVQQSIVECSKELQSKEEELNTLKETVKSFCVDIELKERGFNAIQMSIEEQSEELQGKEKELKSVHSSIEEGKGELKVIQGQKRSLQKSIVECSEELESKKKDLDVVTKSLKECSDKLESRLAQLDSIQRTSSELSEKLKEKEEFLDSLKKELDERLEKLGMREMQLEQRVKEFELKEKQFHSMQKLEEKCCKEVELNEKQLSDNLHLQVSTEQPENLTANDASNSSFGSLQCCITANGKYLQLFLNEHLRKHDSVHNEVFNAIQKSPDPAKLVLDAVQEFYPAGLKNGAVEFGLSVIRRSCITLLEQLFKISPRIKPEIREEALKLASEWKAKMRVVPENTLEVLGFLRLLAAFNLATAFSAHELQKLLDAIAQNKHTTELQQALGIADNLCGSNILSRNVKIEQPDSNPTYASSANFQFTATIGERSSQLVSNECGGEYYLTYHEVVNAILLSPDPAKLVLDMMQGYYSKHQKHESMEFDPSVMRYKVLLLEQLMQVSPKISPQVKEVAIKFAVFWKKHMRLETQNSMEILAFLLFLAIYGIVSSFRGDDILRLVEVVAQIKQAPEIFRALGLTNKIPDFIRSLIERNQHIEAARFSVAFGLFNMFPPELILKEYLEKTMVDVLVSKDGKNPVETPYNAIVKELAALRAILECITDCKLELLIGTKYITDRIVELEKKEAVRRDSFPAHNPMNQPSPQGREDHVDTAPAVQPQLRNSNSEDQLQQQGNYKRPRLDAQITRGKSPAGAFLS